MPNAKYKIIGKLLADMLVRVLPHTISKDQKGFIHGRSIKECIFLTLEAANMLHKKYLGGNIAMKVDIEMAIDTLSWDFLMKVLKTFGFNDIFYSWILCIL